MQENAAAEAQGPGILEGNKVLFHTQLKLTPTRQLTIPESDPTVSN